MSNAPPSKQEQQNSPSELIVGCTFEQWEGGYDFGRDTSHNKLLPEYLAKVAERKRKLAAYNAI